MKKKFTLTYIKLIGFRAIRPWNKKLDVQIWNVLVIVVVFA